MSDLYAVLLAVGAAAGALVPRPWPVPLALAVVTAGLVARRPLLLCLAVMVAASGLAARSWDGLRPPLPHPFSGTVTLVSDPADVAGAVKLDVRLQGNRVEAWARGRNAGRLRWALAGERVWLRGHVSPVPAGERRRVAPRHVSARLTVEEVGARLPGTWPSELANRIRRALLRGAERLPPDRRSLFAGFVLGDDRGQSPEVAFDFRASGLAHLLVVSGQNVAFVLAVASPLLRRLGLRGRLVAGVAVLVLFGTLTRWEPSVLRAVAMAGIALLTGTLGRPASSIRVLSLAVGGLLLVDPLLVHSIGFRLSVGACTGIALFARALTRALPGPRVVAEALGVTLAAQAGVAPVLIPTFGGLPVVALLANLLALPAAGPLMVWGLAAGLPAGLLGGFVAGLLHLPTRLLLTWVAAVARAAASLPLGQLRMAHVAVVVAGGALTAFAARRGHRRLERTGLSLCAVALLVPALAAVRPGPVADRPVGRGVALWRSGGATVLVLDGARSSADRILSSLHGAAVRRLDVMVVSRPGVTEARTAEAILRRHRARLVLAPPGHRLTRAQVAPPGTEVRAGGLSVRVEHDHGRLVATVTPVGAPPQTRAARGPPG